MGVTGLWQIVQPCARPIKIETLNRKRLAVDASIWIYQFLKAVRDKEGNALRNSHVVGFFRRICKLLFFGIKPVFVFDGGAPALKRQTIRARKSRREGKREDAVRTAGKLLAKQMQRRAEEEEASRRAERDRPAEQEEEVPDEGLVYVEELNMTQQERQQNRKFKKKDAYHLPDLDMSMSEMGGPNDPRVMSLEDLQEYARQFNTGEDINVYDFSKIDYDGQFFMSLPPSDRYNILNAARLRSRLRMGHSKEQLDSMFPDRMAFSKFQIDRVRERNELTQRLMHLNGSETMEFGGGRVAGEKGREYVLVKNDGVEGGWALGVISDEGKEDKPIDVDKPVQTKIETDEEGDDDNEFEDIPIEGLNRLPTKRSQNEEVADQLNKQRRALYQSKRMGATKRSVPRRKPKQKQAKEADTLFVQSSEDEPEEDEDEAEEWEAVGDQEDLFGEKGQPPSDDEDLRKAIAMSMEKDHPAQTADAEPAASDGEENDMLEVFQQKAAEEARPLPKGSGRAIANIVNRRAFVAAPESREITSFGVPTERPDSSDDDDTMDFQAALAESRKNKRRTSAPRRAPSPGKPVADASDIAKKAGFSGPLPFEKLDLGTSLLGKKKMQQRTEEVAGGFEKPGMGEHQKKKAEPLPPWFNADVEENMRAQRMLEAEDREKAKQFSRQFRFEEKGGHALHRGDTNEVIDLEADEFNKSFKDGEVIDLDEEERTASLPAVQETRASGSPDHQMTEALSPGPPPTQENNDKIAESVRADPPPAPQDAEIEATAALTNANIPLNEASGLVSPSEHEEDQDADKVESTSGQIEVAEAGDSNEAEDEEVIDWSESDRESTSAKITKEITSPVPDQQVRRPSRSPSAEFEDVPMLDAPAQTEVSVTNAPGEFDEHELPPGEDVEPAIYLDDDEEFEDFSDPEEEAMLHALTLEAEEHARFASQLNHKPQAQNHQDYERELKQLRNQQKKDRRDADEVTHIMITECQALLRLFGLPYITAPMEAEAQCAELVRLGLVDGIVTDDSDCFLFGGTRIYKNMFNQAKFVECYLTSDLEKEFDLTRDKLISVAHLLGSDYTEGLPGVGPVTALEIISEFGSLDNFKTWWSGVQMNQIPKSEDADKPFRKKFRRNATKLFLPPAFPDARVDIAYQQPEVDSDAQAFQWGVPDLDALRSFLMATIGWSQERTDEVLVPVIKDMNRRLDEGTQANITAFFDGSVGVGAAGVGGEGFAPRKKAEGSKRMGNALTKMAERAKVGRNAPTPVTASGTSTANEAESSSTAGRVARGQKKRKSTKAAEDEAPQSADDGSDFEQPQKKKQTRTRAKRGTQK
jgi:DNA excision repair protein ERCC-5